MNMANASCEWLGIVTLLVWMGVTAGAQHPPPPTLVPLDATGRITYFIAEGIERSGHQAGDTELAEWAFEEWARGIGGALRFETNADEGLSQIRIYWLPWAIAAPGQLALGETRPFRANGRPAASVSIRLNAAMMNEEMARRIRQDALLRDTMVYVTCLHEIGHALGLSDSDDDANIMWGGGKRNLSVYQRYRRRLQTRGSIARVSWLSNDDIARVKALYSRSDEPHPR
jgi:hypothetical protein